MHDFIWRFQASETGPLDFGFQPELFAEDPPHSDPAQPPAGQPADEPVYGPADGLAFPAFHLSEAGGRATRQMTRCVETIAAFARDRGEAATADGVLNLNKIICDGLKGNMNQAPYIPDLYSRGKHALEQIVVMLCASKQPGPGNELRERDALQCVRLLGEGLQNCGARTLAELIDAESRLRQLGDGLKSSAQRVCRNTVETAVVRTLSKHGEVAGAYLVDPHNRLQLDARIGLPWAHAPERDPHYHKPPDFELRGQECRRAVQRSVTPSAVARVLARECLHDVRTSLRAWTGETQDLAGADWPTLRSLVAMEGQRFGPLREQSFVHGDGVLEPVTMRDDEWAVLSDIRTNLVSSGLVKERDRTLRQDNEDGSSWTFVLKQSAVPLVIEEDERGRHERTPLLADFIRALRAPSSGLEGGPEGGHEFAWELADPSVLAEVVEGAVAGRDTPPVTWDATLLAAPGVLPYLCNELNNEAATQLLREMAGRSDIGESGLGYAVLAMALARKLPVATSAAIDAMKVADLRARWSDLLPALQAALQAGDDALADAGLVALDRLMPAGDLPGWHACRREVLGFQAGVTAQWLEPSPCPWPRDVSTRLGLLHREGLLPGPVIVTLLRADARLGEFLDGTRLHSGTEPLHRMLAYLAQIGNELALSPDDMRALLRPIAEPESEMEDRAGTSPLCSAVMHGHPAHVTAFLTWMTTHADAPWMPPLQELALPDEVLVPRTNAPAVVVRALKAYLEGLTTLQRQGRIDGAALAPLLQAGSAGAARAPNGLPSGPGMALVRKVLELAGTNAFCAQVLADWREDHARRTVANVAVSTGVAPANARAAPMPDRVAALTRGPDRAVPTSQELPSDLLESQLVHHGIHGYLGVDALVEKIRSAWRSLGNLPGQLGRDEGFRLLKRLASSGVLPPTLCVELSTRSTYAKWEEELFDRDKVVWLRHYFDLLEHLAGLTPGLADFDRHLHVGGHERPTTLSGHCLSNQRHPGDMFDALLDGALAARRRGRITSAQLSAHFAARHPLTDAPALTALLVLDRSREPPVFGDAARAPRQNRGDELLKQWLYRLLLAEQDQCLTPAEVVVLLTTPDAKGASPLFFAMSTGQTKRLPLLFDWLVRATEGRSSVLARRLGGILLGGSHRGPTFEALRQGRVESLDTWLAGIRQLRERQCLSNADYVSLLVPNVAGDQHAIKEAATRDDEGARACAARLRLAATQGQALGWIADDELREILDPLDLPGLSA